MKSKLTVAVYTAIAVCSTFLICQWLSAGRVPSEVEELLDTLRAQTEALSGLNRVQERQIQLQEEIIDGQEELIEIQENQIGTLQLRDELEDGAR